MNDYLRIKKKKEKKWVKITRSELKKKSTPFEDIVFHYLVEHGIKHVIKQHPIKVYGHRYFLDLYIRSRKIAIEVDGGYHNNPEQIVKDIERDESLKRKKGINTLRITNADVLDPEKLDSLFYRILTFGIN
jgi:very-short-patch-repair endonuclease